MSNAKGRWRRVSSKMAGGGSLLRGSRNTASSYIYNWPVRETVAPNSYHPVIHGFSRDKTKPPLALRFKAWALEAES